MQQALSVPHKSYLLQVSFVFHLDSFSTYLPLVSTSLCASSTPFLTRRSLHPQRTFGGATPYMLCETLIVTGHKVSGRRCSAAKITANKDAPAHSSRIGMRWKTSRANFEMLLVSAIIGCLRIFLAASFEHKIYGDPL